MAGMGPAPKPDKSGRTARAFEWTYLPAAGRKGKAPALPPLRSWGSADRKHWAELWAMPQATAWESGGHVEVVGRLLALRHDFARTPRLASGLSAELRQLEDRLGLSPKALMGLRWRIVDEDPAPTGSTVRAPSAARQRLRTVPPASA